MTIGTDLDAAFVAVYARIDALAQASANATLAAMKQVQAEYQAADALIAQKLLQDDAQLANHDARIAKLEGTPVPIPPANHPPVWTTMPNVNFTKGIAASFSVAPFVSDVDIGDTLTLTFSGSLPAGVTFDGPGKRLVYDGVGAVAATSGNQIIADDGRP